MGGPGSGRKKGSGSGKSYTNQKTNTTSFQKKKKTSDFNSNTFNKVIASRKAKMGKK